MESLLWAGPITMVMISISTDSLIIKGGSWDNDEGGDLEGGD